jgi:hypothetical protein
VPNLLRETAGKIPSMFGETKEIYSLFRLGRFTKNYDATSVWCEH